jgi:hypothetical protein
MPDDRDNDDKKVKDMLDAGTRAELERWFGLPSFEQLAEQGIQPKAPPEDPEMAAVRKRRADALAAVDPAILEAHRRRMESSERLLTVKATIEVRIDPSIMSLDLSLIDRQRTVAEPREVQLPPELYDDLNECTPQALLRDLHRPELLFDKLFEIIDPIAEQRVDVTAVVAQAMTAHAQRPVFAKPAYHEAGAVLRELREVRRQPWTDIKMPNRRVTE